MLPYAQTFHGPLAKLFEGKLRFYSFAASGAPLSQFLVWARYAVSKFKARALVINVAFEAWFGSVASTPPAPSPSRVTAANLFVGEP